VDFANSTFAIGEIRGEIRQLAKFVRKFANKINFFDLQARQLSNFAKNFASWRKQELATRYYPLYR
jgi:hypothetical protein